MGVNSSTQSRRERFDELMTAGDQALLDGDRRGAHDRWREAATLDPYDEQVWTSLLRVLDDEEDRRVCLENIIAINPMNVQARRLMHRQSPDASNSAIPVLAPAQATETATQPKRPDAARPKTKTSTQPRTAVKQKPGQKQSQKQKSKKAQPKAKPKRSIGRLLLLVVSALIIAVLIGLLVSILVFGRH